MSAIAGILLIISGWKMYVTEWDSHYKMPATPMAGCIIGLLGLILFISALLPPSRKKKAYDNKLFICSNCSEKYKAKHVEIFVCPKCDGKLVGYKE